jgi:hypothetical protein
MNCVGATDRSTVCLTRGNAPLPRRDPRARQRHAIRPATPEAQVLARTLGGQAKLLVTLAKHP